jgi:hypothetical protein
MFTPVLPLYVQNSDAHFALVGLVLAGKSIGI